MKNKAIVIIFCIMCLCGCSFSNDNKNTETLKPEDINSESANEAEVKPYKAEKKYDYEKYPIVKSEELGFPEFHEDVKYLNVKKSNDFVINSLDSLPEGYERVFYSVKDYNDRIEKRLYSLNDFEYDRLSNFLFPGQLLRIDRKVISYMDYFPKTFDVETGKELRLKDVFEENEDSLNCIKEKLREKVDAQLYDWVDSISFEDVTRWFFDADSICIEFYYDDKVIFINFSYYEEMNYINEKYLPETDNFFMKSHLKDKDKVIVLGQEISELNEIWDNCGHYNDYTLYADDGYVAYSNGSGTYVFLQLTFKHRYLIKFTNNSYEVVKTYIENDDNSKYVIHESQMEELITNYMNGN